MALSVYAQRHRPAHTEPPRDRYKQHDADDLQPTDEVEIVVKMTDALRLVVRPAVDVAEVERREPDVVEPLDRRQAEQSAGAL